MSVIFAAALAVALVCAGASLLRFSRVKEVGQDLRCARCDYILYRMTGGNCPECGAPVSESTRSQVTSFDRGPRAIMGCAGVVLFALGLLFALMTVLAIWVNVILKAGT